LPNLRKSKKGPPRQYGQMIHGYRSMLGRLWTKMVNLGQNEQQKLQKRYNSAQILLLLIMS
jgi:hypothetical protein